MEIKAEKVVLTYARVEIPSRWIECRVWADGTVEEWMLSPSGETWEWQRYDEDKDFYEEIKKAGLEALNT